MTEYSKQRVGESTQTLAGAPGGFGNTPNYMQEYPLETNLNSTTYDAKNAIWNSGTSSLGYRNISFAGGTSGLQFRADTNNTSAPSGIPGSPDPTNVYLRVRRAERSYDPWAEIYHSGNLDISKYAKKSLVEQKADMTYVSSQNGSKLEQAYFDKNITSINDRLAAKVDQAHVEKTLGNYIDTATANDSIDKKANFEAFLNQYKKELNKLKEFENLASSLDSRINIMIQNKKNNIK